MLQHLKEKIQQGLHDKINSSSTTASLARSVPVTDVDYDADSFNALIAGVELTDRTFNYFYNPSHKQFCTPHNEPGTIDSQHGYVVWPVSIGFWAVADAARRSQREEDLRDLDMAFAAMERHWNPEERGYCTWHMHPGNRDLYFDDNAHCGNALVTAYEATQNPAYLDRAKDIVTGIIDKGRDRGEPGGIMWHIDNQNTRNACSTLSVAMLACRLALLNVERDYCTDLARACLMFSEKHLVASDDGLILDAIHRDGDSWRHDDRKFTYNTGFAIEAHLLFSKLTNDASHLDKATKLALTAVDPHSALFDQTLDPSQRHWWDSVFFAHHLVEALVLLAAAHGLDTAPGRTVTNYLVRLAGHIRTYIYDSRDHMYFRELRMYFINQERTDWFNREFGASQTLTLVQDDREQGPASDVTNRRQVKTLIANASVARMFLCISDLQRQIPLPPKGAEILKAGAAGSFK